MGSKTMESVGRIRRRGGREQGKGNGRYCSDLAFNAKEGKTNDLACRQGLKNGPV